MDQLFAPAAVAIASLLGNAVVSLMGKAKHAGAVQEKIEGHERRLNSHRERIDELDAEQRKHADRITRVETRCDLMHGKD